MATAQSGFTSQDFLPRCQDSGGIFQKPVYEPFSALIVRANEWLYTNRKWKVITCESVDFKYERINTDFNKMSYTEYGGKRITSYMRGLRLWLKELEKEQVQAQQIGYLNLIPQEVERAGFFTSAVFESLDTVIEKFNYGIRYNPLPGKVISVETPKMKLDWISKFEPDSSIWDVQGDDGTTFLFIVRIFYEVTERKPEEIALKDFVPELLHSGGLFSTPQYEPFSSLVNKVSCWRAQNSHVRICNVKSVEIKRSDIEINAQKMKYSEDTIAHTSYARILRVAYVKSYPLYPDVGASSVDRFVCVNFLPGKIKSGIFSPTYEDLTVVKEKVSTWVKATGAQVLCVETAAWRAYNFDTRYAAEGIYSISDPDRNKCWIRFIRLYLSAA